MLKFLKNNLYALVFLAILLGACFGGYKYYKSQKATKTETVKTLPAASARWIMWISAPRLQVVS